MKNLIIKIKYFYYDKRKTILIVSFFIILFLLTGFYNHFKSMPEGSDFISKKFIAKSEEIKFLYDLSFQKNSETVHNQMIFDQVLRNIKQAEYYILIDMFLFNDLLGNASNAFRPLSQELSEALVKKKNDYPNIKIDFISDPINTVYGGAKSPHLEKLKSAGINVITTNLSPLRDSNPVYSSLWRSIFKLFGNSDSGTLLKNPFGDNGPRVSLRSYLSMLNFKANHRKVFVGDNNGTMQSLILSANPHDGSSAHSNVAIQINGDFWQSVWLSESAVAKMSGSKLQSPPILNDTEVIAGKDHSISLELITEKQIKRSLLEGINSSLDSDEIFIGIFYLSDRDVVKALIDASKRNVNIKIVMDPNKDAFGYKKIGIPNRQVAHELAKKSKDKIQIRWYDTHGEQYHTKLAYIAHKNGPTRVILGSANFTRRNIDNYNLETDVLVIAPSSSVFIQDVKKYFDRIWKNIDGDYTLDYSEYHDNSLFKYLVYRVQEGTGLSSF